MTNDTKPIPAGVLPELPRIEDTIWAMISEAGLKQMSAYAKKYGALCYEAGFAAGRGVREDEIKRYARHFECWNKNGILAALDKKDIENERLKAELAALSYAAKQRAERALFEEWLNQGHHNGANESMWKAWQAAIASVKGEL